MNEYYVFTGVEKGGIQKEDEIKEISEFLSLITSKKHTVLEGTDSSGKTALLKQIYLSLIMKNIVNNRLSGGHYKGLTIVTEDKFAEQCLIEILRKFKH